MKARAVAVMSGLVLISWGTEWNHWSPAGPFDVLDPHLHGLVVVGVGHEPIAVEPGDLRLPLDLGQPQGHVSRTSTLWISASRGVRSMIEVFSAGAGAGGLRADDVGEGAVPRRPDSTGIRGGAVDFRRMTAGSAAVTVGFLGASTVKFARARL